VLCPEGDLTIFEAAVFHQALVQLHEQDSPLEIDLSNVERIDSSGIQLILAGLKKKEMKITAVQSSVRESFARIGCGTLV
jgi:anti-anti-sigma regulatory factor